MISHSIDHTLRIAKWSPFCMPTLNVHYWELESPERETYFVYLSTFPWPRPYVLTEIISRCWNIRLFNNYFIITILFWIFFFTTRLTHKLFRAPYNLQGVCRFPRRKKVPEAGDLWRNIWLTSLWKTKNHRKLWEGALTSFAIWSYNS